MSDLEREPGASSCRTWYVAARTTPDLASFTAAPGQGASFIATRGGFARIEPVSAVAAAWLRANVNDDATWFGDNLIVEMRCFGDIAEGIMAAGFLFERHAFPN